MAGIDYNLRGLNVYNMIKRVIWACVTDRPPSGEVDGDSIVNLKLLKGLLNEIQTEVYICDVLLRTKNSLTYEPIDINDTKGYDDFK